MTPREKRIIAATMIVGLVGCILWSLHLGGVF